jgi:hypothetical protein
LPLQVQDERVYCALACHARGAQHQAQRAPVLLQRAHKALNHRQAELQMAWIWRHRDRHLSVAAQILLDRLAEVVLYVADPELALGTFHFGAQQAERLVEQVVQHVQAAPADTQPEASVGGYSTPATKLRLSHELRLPANPVNRSV